MLRTVEAADLPAVVRVAGHGRRNVVAVCERLTALSTANRRRPEILLDGQTLDDQPRQHVVELLIRQWIGGHSCMHSD